MVDAILERSDVKHRMQLLEKVPPTDWIVHADNDEFHSYGGKSVIDFLKEMDKKGYNEVRGTYVDRVSKSGELSKLKEEPGMFQQFPLRCSVIKTVAGGRDFKTMAYKGYWRTGQREPSGVARGESKGVFKRAGERRRRFRRRLSFDAVRKVSGKIQVPVRCAR